MAKKVGVDHIGIFYEPTAEARDALDLKLRTVAKEITGGNKKNEDYFYKVMYGLGFRLIHKVGANNGVQQQDLLDIVQEAVVAMHEKINARKIDLDGHGRLVNYFRKILEAKSAQYWRDKKRNSNIRVNEDPIHLLSVHGTSKSRRWKLVKSIAERRDPTPLQSSIKKNDIEHLGIVLDTAFEKLEPRTKRIIDMHLIEGLSFGEIGKLLGVSRQSPGKSYQRGMEQLRLSIRSHPLYDRSWMVEFEPDLGFVLDWAPRVDQN